jgi:hypothetical protein
MDEFQIQSAHGEARLLFNDRSPFSSEEPLDSFFVQFADRDITAAVLIQSDEDWAHPRQLFTEMAKQWTGWSGELSWRSIFGGMELRCSHDRRGHVTIQIELSSDLPTRWRLQAHIEVEAGQLDTLASKASAFFGKEG